MCIHSHIVGSLFHMESLVFDFKVIIVFSEGGRHVKDSINSYSVCNELVRGGFGHLSSDDSAAGLLVLLLCNECEYENTHTVFQGGLVCLCLLICADIMPEECICSAGVMVCFAPALFRQPPL